MIRVSVALPVLFFASSEMATGAELMPPDVSSPTRVVRFTDLNLSQPMGIQVLYARLKSASAAVCGNPSRPNSAIVSDAWQKCANEALQHAVRQLDRPALTAYHAARIGVEPAAVRAATAPIPTNGS